MKEAYGKPSFFKKVGNRIDVRTRFFLALVGFSVVTSSPLIWRGLANGKFDEERRFWIRTELRDIEKNPYSKFDEEAPPSPVRKSDRL